MTELKDFQPFDNFKETHQHEEELRSASLNIINEDAAMRLKFGLIEKALMLLFAFVHDTKSQSSDEHTMQMLGIRVFNAGVSSIKLGLSGYYQTAFGLIRDVMETGFLIDYFRTSPEMISKWAAAGDRERQRTFSPAKVRAALDIRDGDTDGRRAKQYKILCELAAHASVSGFGLTMRQGFGELGPFVEEVKLRAWIEETIRRLGPTAILFARHFPNAQPEFLRFGQDFSTDLIAALNPDKTVPHAEP
ncbi:MAG: hypothetical protein Q7T81_14705 [Pseudolabrys sp.]|nr:hypothetical protein [Pseudolabrys sp.]